MRGSPLHQTDLRGSSSRGLWDAGAGLITTRSNGALRGEFLSRKDLLPRSGTVSLHLTFLAVMIPSWPCFIAFAAIRSSTVGAECPGTPLWTMPSCLGPSGILIRSSILPGMMSRMRGNRQPALVHTEGQDTEGRQHPRGRKRAWRLVCRPNGTRGSLDRTPDADRTQP